LEKVAPEPSQWRQAAGSSPPLSFVAFTFHGSLLLFAHTQMLQVLGDSQSGVRAQAARVVASIGAIDIPDNQWQQLIDILERNIQSQNEALKHSSFMALGYVCEACPDSLEEKSSRILQCIMSGMKDNQSVEVKLAAVIALYSTLEFCKSNFENATHRNHIMQMIYQSTTCPDDRIREKAFMCLVQIVEFYYEHVGEHMVKIFQVRLPLQDASAGSTPPSFI
jgi:importin subunit beta-1